MSPLAQMLQLLVLTTCALGAVYFIFYRPTISAQNRQRRVIAGLRQGDEIVTTSGFIATVVDIREPDDGPVELLLDLGDGRIVRARTSAVADRLPRPDEQGDNKDDSHPVQAGEISADAEPALTGNAVIRPAAERRVRETVARDNRQ
jgi:preprotein translocase YajC subunit